MNPRNILFFSILISTPMIFSSYAQANTYTHSCYVVYKPNHYKYEQKPLFTPDDWEEKGYKLISENERVPGDLILRENAAESYHYQDVWPLINFTFNFGITRHGLKYSVYRWEAKLRAHLTFEIVEESNSYGLKSVPICAPLSVNITDEYHSLTTQTEATSGYEDVWDDFRDMAYEVLPHCQELITRCQIPH